MKSIVLMVILIISAFFFGNYMHSTSIKDATHIIFYDGSKYYVKDSSNGLQYQTQSQADNVAIALRSYARQLAWLAENNDGWVADWNNINQNKYFIYQTKNNIYFPDWEANKRTLSTIYMSLENAEKLCKLLNSGIVKF